MFLSRLANRMPQQSPYVRDLVRQAEHTIALVGSSFGYPVIQPKVAGRKSRPGQPTRENSMNKKALQTLVLGLVEKTATAHGLSGPEGLVVAQSLLGLALSRAGEALVAATNPPVAVPAT